MARLHTNGNAYGSGGGPGGRSAPNLGFARTSFLHGANAAYIEQLEDSYERDPASLDQSWRDFFAQLKDDSLAIARHAGLRHADLLEGAGGDELVSALDGNWREAAAIGKTLEAKAAEGGVASGR